MRHLCKITAAILIMVMIVTLCAGCSGVSESSKYRSYEKFASRVARGKDFDKDATVFDLGRPQAYQNQDTVSSCMDECIQEWTYEVFDSTGYPWRLTICFDESGKVVSADFSPVPGG